MAFPEAYFLFIQKLKTFGASLALVDENNSISYIELAEILSKKPANSVTDSVKIIIEPKVDGIINFLSFWSQNIIVEPVSIDDTNQSPFLQDEKEEQEACHLLLYTSGTTGKPKPVLLSTNELIDKYLKLKTALSTVLVFSLSHISGIETLLSVISAGGTVFLPKTTNPSDVLELVLRHKIDFMACSPSYFKFLVLADNNRLLRQLRFVNLGGETTRSPDLELFVKQYPEVVFYQAFGTTESTNIRTFSKPNSLWFKPGIYGKDYKVVDSFLLVKAKKSGRIFWHKTGDRVAIDEEQQIRIMGRESKLINTGGEKVDPVLIEEKLLELPEIQEVKVYGKSHPLLGEAVAADIVFKNKVLSRNQLTQLLKGKLRTFEMPLYVFNVEVIYLTKSLKRN